MIDESDGDFALLMSNGAGPVFGIIMILLAAGLYYVACKNEKECSQRECPTGQVAKLLDHECLCVAPAPETK